MLDWLYGELPDAEAAEFERHVDGCESCGSEAAQLRETRELYAALPLEDPPAGFSPSILQEAAKQAQKHRERAERGSVWNRFADWMQPVAAHPALAAAASLLVVTTVVGTMYVNKGSEMIARPGAESATPVLANEKSPAPEVELADVVEATTPEDEESIEVDGVFATQPKRDAPASGSIENSKVGYRAEMAPQEVQKKVKERVQDRKPLAKRRRASKDSSYLGRASGGKFADDPLAGLDVGGGPAAPARKTEPRKTERRSAAPPPPEPAQSVADDADEVMMAEEAEPRTSTVAEGEAKTRDVRSADKEKSKKQTAKDSLDKRQGDRVVTLLKKNACESAVREANAFRSRSPDAYRARFDSSKSLTRCRRVAAEIARKRASKKAKPADTASSAETDEAAATKK